MRNIESRVKSSEKTKEELDMEIPRLLEEDIGLMSKKHMAIQIFDDGTTDYVVYSDGAITSYEVFRGKDDHKYTRSGDMTKEQFLAWVKEDYERSLRVYRSLFEYQKLPDREPTKISSPDYLF